MTLIFLGGASRAGKSHAARWVARRTGLPVEGLDRHLAAPRAGEALDTRDLKQARQDAARLVRRRLSAGWHGLLEGWWITPGQAADWQATGGFSALFCGYPQADPEARDAMLCAAKGGAWYKARPRHARLQLLARQIALSQQLQADCTALDLPFVDVSDLTTGVEGVRARLMDMARA